MGSGPVCLALESVVGISTASKWVGRVGSLWMDAPVCWLVKVQKDEQENGRTLPNLPTKVILIRLMASPDAGTNQEAGGLLPRRGSMSPAEKITPSPMSANAYSLMFLSFLLPPYRSPRDNLIPMTDF